MVNNSTNILSTRETNAFKNPESTKYVKEAVLLVTRNQAWSWS